MGSGLFTVLCADSNSNSSNSEKNVIITNPQTSSREHLTIKSSTNPHDQNTTRKMSKEMSAFDYAESR